MSLGMPAEHIEETPRSLQTLEAMLSQGQGICPFGPQIKKNPGAPPTARPCRGPPPSFFVKLGLSLLPRFLLLVMKMGVILA